jgi:glutamate---cysteine ligase / carboxylate-amine ligase
VRSFGVEEEMLLVDPASGKAVALAGAVAGEEDDAPESELHRQQIETDTAPCVSLSDLADQIRLRRRDAAEAASRKNCQVAALATSPLEVSPLTTPTERYLRMAAAYALTAQEQLTCGCHVHVRVTSEDEGVGILDRIRTWLPVLLAMTGNSPFWQGRDSGYASYRYQVWGRWPSAGPTEPFGTPKTYHDTVTSMVESGTLVDEGMIYFDARLSRHYPTVEIRVADVCLRAEDAVLLAALVRGLVETSARSWSSGEPPCLVRPELVRLASWRASRSGLGGDLIHPLTSRPAPAKAVVETLLDHVRPALADLGDLETVEDLLDRLLRRGNGATAQRHVFEKTDSLAEVVRDAVGVTSDS